MVHPELEPLVLRRSAERKQIRIAVTEWDIEGSKLIRPSSTDSDGKPIYPGICLCGHQGLKELFTIKNRLTNEELTPIGSRCVKSFDSKKLNEQLKKHQQKLKEELKKSPEYIDKEIRKLWAKVYDRDTGNCEIEINSNYFTKELLGICYNQGFLKPYGISTAKDQYDFLMKCFLQRKPFTPKQKFRADSVLKELIKSLYHYIQENPDAL